MNFIVALALLLLLGLLTLVSYVDRVYQEIGKFLSREFQDNIDAFEQKVEPQLHVSRARASLSMAVLTQLTMAAIALLVGFTVFSDRAVEHLRNSASHDQPDSDRHCLQSISALSCSSRAPRASGWCAGRSCLRDPHLYGRCR